MVNSGVVTNIEREAPSQSGRVERIHLVAGPEWQAQARHIRHDPRGHLPILFAGDRRWRGARASHCDHRLSSSHHIVVQSELVRVGSEPDGVYLLLPLVLNPRLDEILGEDVPFQETAVVLLEGVEDPLQAVRRKRLGYPEGSACPRYRTYIATIMNGTTIIVLLSWFP